MFETAVPWFQLVVAEGAAAPPYDLSHCLVGWPVAPSSPSAGQQKKKKALTTGHSTVRATVFMTKICLTLFTFSFCVTGLLLKCEYSTDFSLGYNINKVGEGERDLKDGSLWRCRSVLDKTGSRL